MTRSTIEDVKRRRLAEMSADERALAMAWARAQSAAAIEGTEDRPTVPACIGALYARLMTREESEP